MKKILLLTVLFIFLTGCVSVTVPDDNDCYRYIDYQGEEHYMDYQGNSCSVTGGYMSCRDGSIRKQVMEFEITECPKEEE